MQNGPYFMRPPSLPRPARWKTGWKRRSVSSKDVSPPRGKTWPLADATRVTPRRPSAGPARRWTGCLAMKHAHDDFRPPAADGRQLAVKISGNPTGHPVFIQHGTPGSRVGPFPKGRVLYELGIRLISFDRPGYGGSDRLDGRRVADVVPDVAAIADALELDRFAVLGRSGGGPHALACGALLPDRVTRVGVLVSLAPWAAEGLDWFAGIAESNVREYIAAASEPELLNARLVQTAAEIKANPASHVAALGPEMPAADRRMVADVGIRALLARNYAEALRDSADGWIDDALALCARWGFDLADIKVPVLLWHGQNDVFVPVAHARSLAEKIPSAVMSISPGSAHFAALEVMQDVLSWLIRPF
jgi:pimeloyl-ACP methyl ester carboxylesterase